MSQNLQFLARKIKNLFISHGIKTQGKTSLFVNKIYFIDLMTSIDFNNGQKTMCKVIWGYICTLKIKIYIKNNTWNVIIFNAMHIVIAEFGGSG